MPAATVRIEIAEIANRGRYAVWVDGAVICETRTPLCSAARILLARGIDPDTVLEKVRRGRDRVDMWARLGDAAKLTVSEARIPLFVPFAPFPGRQVFETEDAI